MEKKKFKDNIKRAVKDLKACDGFFLLVTKNDQIGTAVHTETSNELARMILEAEMFVAALKERWAMYNVMSANKGGEKDARKQSYIG